MTLKSRAEARDNEKKNDKKDRHRYAICTRVHTRHFNPDDHNVWLDQLAILHSDTLRDLVPLL